MMATFVILFFLDIYLGFREFIKWFDAANKLLKGAIPGNGFTLVTSFKHPILSGLWYSNKAFPAAVIYAYQFPTSNAMLINLSTTGGNGEQLLLQMWQYAAGLNLQPPTNESVCQEPTQDLDIPGCIICAAFATALPGACLETCPGTNFSWMNFAANLVGQSSMGIMTGAAIGGESGGPIGAAIGGLIMFAFSLGSGLYERSSAISQCQQQRQQSMCNVQGAPSCT